MSRTTSTNRSVKLVGLLTIIAGVLMIVAGGVTWALVTSQLKAENITVAAVTPANPGWLAGKPVADPFTAYAQAAAINHHALDGANGRTYAQLGDDAKALTAKLAASGLSKEEVAKNPDVLALAATRDSTMNGSFLRASLFTSVVAFGVAALVMGLGLLFALLGFALRRISTSDVVIYAQPSGDVGAGEPVGAKA
jgi:ABC-type sugar transport system permease subunit